MRNGVSLRRTLAPRPPRAPAAVTVILHTNGRHGDAQVAPAAACIAVHCADPVGGAQKVTEKACVAVRI